jgi:hypothetical protein
MSRDNFWFTRVVGIRIRNEAPPDPEMGPGIRISQRVPETRFQIQIAERSETGMGPPKKAYYQKQDPLSANRQHNTTTLKKPC